MKKIFPVLNVVLLYLIVVPFVINTDAVNDFFESYITPVYFQAVIISGILSAIYAFYLYKKEDAKNLKFAMCVSVFGPVPYYLLVGMFWVVLTAAATGYDSTVAVAFLAMVWMSFILWTNAFYGLNLARLEKRSLPHKILHFAFIANLFVTISLLLKRKAD